MNVNLMAAVVFAAAGAVAVVAGVAMVSTPGALIVAGVFLLGAGLLGVDIDPTGARRPRKGPKGR